ncbi:hypothetical protein [Achromobacter xylosoxidans]|uniref:hypothetical protein n=2 Tax=Alcaligenes xylosoxydans xylosoxydans TaxID=85698 RepID=UPI001F14658C|nr:hypothetical protein [Achromobacter xylosoxidans]
MGRDDSEVCMGDSMNYHGFHDAELIGIDCPLDSCVILRFKLVNEDREEVVLEKVRSIRICDFIGQNVVSRLLDSSLAESGCLNFDDKVEWLYTLSDGTRLINDDAMDEIKRGVGNGSFRLFVLEPSWGG